MKYRTWRCLVPMLAAGFIGCSNPPPPPTTGSGNGGSTSGGRSGGSTGSGGSSSSSGGSTGSGGSSTSGTGGSSTSSGGTSGGSGGAGGSSTASGGSSGSSGGATGSGGATAGTGGMMMGNPDGGMSGMGGTGGGMNMAGACPQDVHGHCAQTDYPTYPGFKLALVEDFEQPIDLDTDPVWTYGDGALDEGQVRMAKAGITFEGGRMKLTASKMQMGGGQSFSEDKTVAAQPVRSGEFQSKYNNFRYGRYEVRLKPPTSNGNFISTMFAFRTPKVLSWREVDIELTAGSKTVVGTNVVFGDNKTTYDQTANSYMEPSGGGAFDNQADFHTYAFEWLPNKITWYVDGKEVRSHAGPTPPLPEKSAKIMMNLWIFNATYGFGGRNGAANAYPLVAEYDWFRFYKADMDNTYPCWETPTCLPMPDRVRSKNNSTDGVTDVR